MSPYPYSPLGSDAAEEKGGKLKTSLYMPNDDSVNGVLMIALQNFKVKHIVVTVRLAAYLELGWGGQGLMG